MVLKTNAVVHRSDEVWSKKDRAEIQQIVKHLRQAYAERHTEAVSEYHQAERAANRALHEVHRLEKHLHHIDEFCKKNNIILKEE